MDLRFEIFYFFLNVAHHLAMIWLGMRLIDWRYGRCKWRVPVMITIWTTVLGMLVSHYHDV
jgi:hypothetical protein